MEVRLAGRNGELLTNWDAWAKILQLAHYYGWRPVTKTHALYLSNAGRLVTARDAASIATALERALPDIPDESGEGGGIDVTTNAYDYFSGERKQSLRDLILFCRMGEFRINA